VEREIVVVGHYAHDSLVSSSGQLDELGGSAAYVSAVLDALGIDYAVVGAAGPDFRYAGRVRHPPRIAPSARTTAFIDDYRSGERISTAVFRAPAIEPAELREPCAVGIACGVSGEIPPETLLRLRELSGIVVVDAQAVVRGFDGAGTVVHRSPPPEMVRALQGVDWMKASRTEAPALPRTGLQCGFIVTDGAHGCSLDWGGVTVPIAAFPAQEIDPTGAGDCFLAGFSVGLLRGWDPVRAARFGAYCGALAVGQQGVPELARADFDRFSG
jgi:1D-myo-inositol 3-kinase